MWPLAWIYNSCSSGSPLQSPGSVLSSHLSVVHHFNFSRNVPLLLLMCVWLLTTTTKKKLQKKNKGSHLNDSANGCVARALPVWKQQWDTYISGERLKNGQKRNFWRMQTCAGTVSELQWIIKRQEVASALTLLSDVITNSINSADGFVGIIVFL